jgi:cobalt-zinc-cadmium resistance protein CzcA
MFKPMALTVIFALLGSLALSLTYVPAAMTLVLHGHVSEKESFLIHYAKKLYQPVFEFINHNRPQAIAIATGVVLLSYSLFPFLGSEFIPKLDEGSLVIECRTLPSISLEQAVKSHINAQKVLGRFPEVTKIVSKIGRAEVTIDPMSVDLADMYVNLKPPSEWTSAHSKEELVEKMSAALEKEIPDLAFGFSQPIEMRMSELIAGVRADVAIKVFGDELETLTKTANQIARIANRIPGAADVKVEQVTGLPQLQIKPDRAAIARYGLNIEDINDLVESIVAGKPAGQIYEGDQRFNLIVRLTEKASQNVETIKNLQVMAPNGARIPLSQLAEVSVIDGQGEISREQARRRVVVEMNVRGRDIGSFVKEAKNIIGKQVNVPSGYYVTYGGEFENLERASARLMVVVPIALLLIFILLFSTFNSTKQALLIYTGIPFAIVGGIIALFLRGMPFSISAGVGFIALFGVAVLNGLVMVSAINQLRDKGHSLDEAISEGAQTRLRPVLMTALVASLGFIPMAISTSAGAEVQRPLATVVIGGLITSTLLTLLILPTLYGWFARISKRD